MARISPDMQSYLVSGLGVVMVVAAIVLSASDPESENTAEQPQADTSVASPPSPLN